MIFDNSPISGGAFGLGVGWEHIAPDVKYGADIHGVYKTHHQQH